MGYIGIFMEYATSWNENVYITRTVPIQRKVTRLKMSEMQIEKMELAAAFYRKWSAHTHTVADRTQRSPLMTRRIIEIKHVFHVSIATAY